MSRFDSDGGDWDYGRYMLWEQAVSNALAGKRGQAALADLEGALLALPEPRLIEGAVAHSGEVCAVGALVLAKRCAAGEDRAAVLADLERVGGPDMNDDIADVTASLGSKYGNMAYSMAWAIGSLNDDEFAGWAGFTPEKRYEAVLQWVRTALGTTGDGLQTVAPKDLSSGGSDGTGKEPTDD